MALTVTRDKDPLTNGDFHIIGDLNWRHGTITFDTAYPTGGNAVTAATFGFGSQLIDLLVFANGAEQPVFDKTNKKVKLFTADGTEATNASNQSAVVVRYMAIGR